jgi:hypothetical protein
MKTTTIIMAVAAGLAWQAMAAGPENSPSATTRVQKGTVYQRAYPFLEPKLTPTYRIDRYGGISSRPWAQTAGWSPGPTYFVSSGEKFHGVRFNLFWPDRIPQ